MLSTNDVTDADYEPEENGAQILKCGVNRVWVDPRYVDRLAVQFRSGRTRIDRRGLIRAPDKGTSRVRARKLAEQRAKGRRRGHGSRKGSARARLPKKNRWMRTIRSQRRTLKEMREDGTLDPASTDITTARPRVSPIHCPHEGQYGN